ncbi:MAG TPA: 4-hydroxyphenylpyruvate dioxygenase [Candidatus Limnocylindrales bacterium]|nr:4-hydroxyphenylpyruvate dioxygenase [Candidatus Limnocylindrales bacterium]
MTAREVEYVELYVSDMASICDYFTVAMGFTQVARSEQDGSSSVLLRQGDVQLIITSGAVTREFLSAHGDGVADVALACDNVDAAREAAEASGALVRSVQGSPVISRFGALSHTLVPAVQPHGARWPTHHSWAFAAAEPNWPAGRVGRLDHVAICLEGNTLGDIADFYREVLGLATYSSEYIDIGAQAMDSIVVRSSSTDVTFTLVAPDPAKGSGQLDSFLDRNGGPGVQHLAFLVDDIVAAVGEFGTRGVNFLRTPDTYYDMQAERFPEMREEIVALRESSVLADRDEWGYLLQLFSRSPHERNTLFYELIQRKGSRGFGAANIRALYEAVESDRLLAE